MSIINHFSEGNNDQEYGGLHSRWKEGDPVFDSERINAQIETLNTIHNNAIQSCIEICDEARDLEAVTHNEELFLDAIIQRLQSLKK